MCAYGQILFTFTKTHASVSRVISCCGLDLHLHQLQWMVLTSVMTESEPLKGQTLSHGEEYKLPFPTHLLLSLYSYVFPVAVSFFPALALVC